MRISLISFEFCFLIFLIFLIFLLSYAQPGEEVGVVALFLSWDLGLGT